MGGTSRPPYSPEQLTRLIEPRTVAVVGASETPGSFGGRTLENLAGFTGTVVGVNPKRTSVLGRPCVPSLSDLDESPDAIVLCVPRQAVEPTLQEAISVGAGGAIVYASGFAETGRPDRITDQERLVATATEGKLPVAGPNCVGLVNVRSGAAMNFMTDCGELIKAGPGGIAILSQSGALGYTVLQGVARGARFSHFLASGNAADIDVADYISYLAGQGEVRSIVALFEGVGDGRKFLTAAAAARDAGIAVIAYKSGNSPVSKQAAMSHTGTLTGETEAYRAAFEHAGVIGVDDLESALELAALFAKTSAPRHGATVGVMATSGGAGVINADKAEENGLTLPDLAEPTRRALEQVVPDFGSVHNPADLTAEVLKTSETFGSCVRAFVDDGGYSAVAVPLVFAHESTTAPRARTLGEVAATTDTAVVAVWMNDWLEGPGTEVLEADPRVALFRSPARAMRGIKAWVDWYEHRDRAAAAPSARRSDPVAAAQARTLIGTGGSLDENTSKRILECYGVATTRGRLVATPAEAVAAAAEVGFPVAVKIASPDIAHKFDIGGVELDLADDGTVAAATARVLEAATRSAPGARIEGVSVELMAASGVEIVVGVRRDVQFGPVLLVGHGGVWVEVLRDVARGLVPVGPDRAADLLTRLRCAPLLGGVRDRPGADLDALVDVVCRVSELATDLADVLVELDVNPVIAGPVGSVAADALVITDVVEEAGNDR